MDGTLHHWNRLVYGGANNSAMGYGANGTFVAGNLGIVRMYVDSLGKTCDSNEQHTKKGDGPYTPASYFE